MLKNEFESQNFVIFEELVDNLGRFDNDMIISNRYAQLAQKTLNGIQCVSVSFFWSKSDERR